MLSHCTYDKVKVLYELSKMLWFIEKHAKQDAKNEKDAQCFDNFEKLAQDLEKHISQLKQDLRI